MKRLKCLSLNIWCVFYVLSEIKYGCMTFAKRFTLCFTQHPNFIFNWDQVLFQAPTDSSFSQSLRVETVIIFEFKIYYSKSKPPLWASLYSACDIPVHVCTWTACCSVANLHWALPACISVAHISSLLRKNFMPDCIKTENVLKLMLLHVNQSGVAAILLFGVTYVGFPK